MPSLRRLLLTAAPLALLPLAASGCLDFAIAMMIHEANTQSPCEEASEFLYQCLTGGESPDDGSGEYPSCEGQALCSAGCINAASCAMISDAFSGMPTAASKSFTDCISACGTGVF